MDTKTSVTLTGDLVNRIEEYHRKIPGRIPSRNEAIHDLLQIGLDSWEANNHRSMVTANVQEGNHQTGTDA